ncbi:CRISPR-associated endonuclease Cas1 [Psychrobacter urativorans]|uniref:CRISPR-associated endonuclease Cas1 n=1 Tax=Psychrobacter urativorans TaxID=45610 RepID=UPI0009FDEFAD
MLNTAFIDVNSNINCNTHTRNHAHTKSQTFHYHSWLPQYPVASILGTEGIGSALYFNAYQQFFADNLQFNSRNRRPPTDPVNVVLSLSYTLLQHICQQAVYSIGFDPYHGVLHSPSYGRQSLACDFTELQRASIDFWVWQLFEQNILTLDDFGFSSATGYPCKLLKSGRAKYYQAFAAIRAGLSKNALNHVWIWQRRLNSYHFHKDLTVKEPNLSFISQLPMT